MRRDGLFFGYDANYVLCCLEEVGGVGNLGEVEVLREELDRVCISGGCSGGDVSVATPVMVEGGDNVPTVNCMCG